MRLMLPPMTDITGVDGVKVDCQAGIGLIPCNDGAPANSAKYQYCLEVCMSYNRDMPLVNRWLVPISCKCIMF